MACVYGVDEGYFIFSWTACRIIRNTHAQIQGTWPNADKFCEALAWTRKCLCMCSDGANSPFCA